jgi:hypothetical protein
MARLGILYSDVIKAASQLSESGKMPTVDGVREALGGTGSKSTIGPMLKRWKEENQEVAQAAGSGLPAALLSAVKGIHENIQSEADQKIDLLRQQHEIDLAELIVQRHQLLAEKHSLLGENTLLSDQLSEQKKFEMKIEAENLSLKISVQNSQTENTGMKLRLQDRTTEITALGEQLNLSRIQFDHYHAASATQRAEDKQSYERKIEQLNASSTGMQEKMFSQQSIIGQQEAQIHHLHSENTELKSTAQTHHDELIARRTNEALYLYREKEMVLARDTLNTHLKSTQDTLSEARMALAGQERQTELVTEQLTQTQNKAHLLDQERIELLLERAELRMTLKSKTDVEAEDSKLLKWQADENR